MEVLNVLEGQLTLQDRFLLLEFLVLKLESNKHGGVIPLSIWFFLYPVCIPKAYQLIFIGNNLSKLDF